MAEGNWQKVREIFDETLLQKPEERRKFVAEACGEDEVLRLEIESLLSSYNNAESFMETPAVAKVADVFETGTKTLEQGKCFGHYEIVEQIGTGGMGEVYLAVDKKLDRQVAVKILNENFSHHESDLQRFIQEAKIASTLDHPNILVIHEFGKLNGMHYIVSEFVRGKTLRDVLKRSSFKISEILDVSIQIVNALVAAHQIHMVHRDIKPENIMIRPDGFVKILDFGLAKLIEQKNRSFNHSEAETKKQNQTAKGVIMGTVGYMSPEQVKGEKVDERTDIFSFGVVLYEMITENQPFASESRNETIAAILKSEPAPLSSHVKDMPEELERIVSKTLRKKPEKRYKNVKDLLIDLQNLKQELEFQDKLEKTVQPNKEEDAETQMFDATTADERQQITTDENIVDNITIKKSGFRKSFVGIFSVLLISAIGFGIWYFAANETNQIESIAVIPFINDSEHADVEYLSDGMTETLIRSLSNIPNLSVKSRNSVFRYKGKEVDPKKVGEELNVQAVLFGQVVQRGEDLSLSLELVDARTENVLWSQKFDRKMSNLVALQSEIAREVSNKLRTKLTSSEQEQVAKTYTQNSEAQKLYLQGRFHLNKTGPMRKNAKEFEKAIEYFKQAIENDPGYALAHSGLADSYALISQWWHAEERVWVSPHKYMPLAKKAALKALELDDNSAEAHASLGRILLFYEYDFVKAEREYKRAIEIDPKYATAHEWYAELLSAKGMHNEGINEILKASELDPFSASIYDTMGTIFEFARKKDEAIIHFEKAVELFPDNLSLRLHLEQAYQAKGMYSKAFEHALYRLRGLGDWKPETIQKLKDTFEEGGWEGYQRLRSEIRLERRKTALKKPKPAYIRSLGLAFQNARLKDKDKTLEYLNKMFEERDPWLVFSKVDHNWDFLRDDPWFKEFMKRVGIPE